MKSVTYIFRIFEDADQRGELISSLLRIQKRSQRLQCGSILCDLHNKKKISLVSEKNIEAIESLEHNDFWVIFRTLDQAIPKLQCSHREVLRLVQTLVSIAGSDLVAKNPTLSLVKWCKANPIQARQIVSEAKTNDKASLSHCAFAIEGLADTELAFDLLHHANENVAAEGLRSLGRLEMKNKATAKRVIDKCYQTVEKESNQNIRSASIETAFRTWAKTDCTKPYRQKEFIQVVISAKSHPEYVQLSAMLFYYDKGLTVESVDQILDALVTSNPNPRAILDWLDGAMCSKNITWNITKVLKAFSAQILQLSEPIEARHLSTFCRWVWNDPKHVSALFSLWLQTGDPRLCSFLLNMSGENQPVEILKTDLPNDDAGQVFIAKKCIGFLWRREVAAASILLCIVKNGRKKARETANNLLYNPLALSYGGDFRSFLLKQTKNSSKRIRDCVGRILEKQQSYIEGLETANNMVELLPSIEQRRAAAVKDAELNQKVQKQAYENSIAAQLAPTQILLCGSKTFIAQKDGVGKTIPKIVPLIEVPYEPELSRLSVVDPVGFNQLLFGFRVVKGSGE